MINRPSRHILHRKMTTEKFWDLSVENVKNIPGGVLLLLKVTLLHGCFSRFLNCTNGTKLRKASDMMVYD